MVNEIKNSLNGSGLTVAIAVARFNEVVTDKLLEGAVRQLELLGVLERGAQREVHGDTVVGKREVDTRKHIFTFHELDTFK